MTGPHFESRLRMTEATAWFSLTNFLGSCRFKICRELVSELAACLDLVFRGIYLFFLYVSRRSSGFYLLPFSSRVIEMISTSKTSSLQWRNTIELFDLFFKKLLSFICIFLRNYWTYSEMIPISESDWVFIRRRTPLPIHAHLYRAELQFSIYEPVHCDINWD